jgi:hypothetical protein
MTIDALRGAATVGGRSHPLLRIDKRYLAPILVTVVLVVGQLTFGFLESWSRTAIAISTAIGVEMVLGRIFFGKWPHLASSYISGISVGMLVRSPAFWPYALCSAISITSKYVLRVEGRHLWNPSNFGIVAMLVLASDAVAGLSIQWGNTFLPMVVVWCFGCVIIYSLGRLHITAAYVAAFIAFSVVRAAVTGHPWLSEVAPITGPMYQLFIFFMITDPRTVVRGKRRQIAVAILIAVMETVIRFASDKGWPLPTGFNAAPAFFALATVGPVAKWLDLRRLRSKAA